MDTARPQSTPQRVAFGPFEVDLVNEQVWCGDEERHLAPKAFAVLRTLVAQPGHLVTKQALFDAVWRDTVVVDGVLSMSIRQLRQALDDDPKQPRYIATVHRRGYRFIGRLRVPSAAPAALARVIHQRSGGNPLFMAGLLSVLERGGVVRQVEEGQWVFQGEATALAQGAPESLRQFIEQQLERLSEAEQRLLEVASVAGVEFSAAAVAAGHDVAVGVLEAQSEDLVRRGHFLRDPGLSDWPDGTVVGRYAFTHALYQDVLYGRIAAASADRRSPGGRLWRAGG